MKYYITQEGRELLESKGKSTIRTRTIGRHAAKYKALYKKSGNPGDEARAQAEIARGREAAREVGREAGAK
jgi:hypothetical protein